MLEKLMSCATRKTPENMLALSGVCGGNGQVPTLRMHINKTTMSSTTAYELIFHTGRQSTTSVALRQSHRHTCPHLGQPPPPTYSHLFLLTEAVMCHFIIAYYFELHGTWLPADNPKGCRWSVRSPPFQVARLVWFPEQGDGRPPDSNINCFNNTYY